MSDAQGHSPSPEPPRSRLRWFQFRLRTLLVAVTLVAGVVFAFRVYVEPYRQQRRTLEVVKQLGGRAVTAEAGPWQRRLLGADLQNITLIDLANCHQIDAYLPHVASLPCLETLVVGGEVFTDAHLRRLRLPKLTGLVLDSTSVTDEALAAWQEEHGAVEVYQSDRQWIGLLPRRAYVIEYDPVENSDHPRLAQLVGTDYFLEVRRSTVPLDASTAPLAPIRKLKHLEQIHISGSRNLTADADLDDLHGWRQVMELRIGGVWVTDEDLAHVGSLQGLETLALCGSQLVSETGWAQLASLNHLKQLALDKSAITDSAVVSLHGLTNLKKLSLRGTRISDAGLKHLTSLKELETLDLEETGVTDSGLPFLKELPHLTTLNLRGTRITDAGLAHLQALPDLLRLSVAGTRVTEAGLNSSGLPGRALIDLDR